jgi:hypothetical protein
MNDPWVFWRLEIHCCAGETIYEWDQTLEEVNLYISLPDTLPSRLLYCTIKPQHVELGVKGNPPYLNHDLGGPVKVDSSFWTIEDRIMHVTLQKRQKGQPWPSAIAGHGNLDAFTADQEQRRLMLERFQEEVCTENFVLFLLHPKLCFLKLSQSASLPSLLPIPSRNTTEDSGCTFCRMGLPEILGFDYYHLFWILISYVHVLDVQHPGFDFSQAQFTGNVPNPSTFLGGIKQ